MGGRRQRSKHKHDRRAVLLDLVLSIPAVGSATAVWAARATRDGAPGVSSHVGVSTSTPPATATDTRTRRRRRPSWPTRRRSPIHSRDATAAGTMPHRQHKARERRTRPQEGAAASAATAAAVDATAREGQGGRAGGQLWKRVLASVPPGRCQARAIDPTLRSSSAGRSAHLGRTQPAGRPLGASPGRCHLGRGRGDYRGADDAQAAAVDDSTTRSPRWNHWALWPQTPSSTVSGTTSAQGRVAIPSTLSGRPICPIVWRGRRAPAAWAHAAATVRRPQTQQLPPGRLSRPRGMGRGEVPGVTQGGMVTRNGGRGHGNEGNERVDTSHERPPDAAVERQRPRSRPTAPTRIDSAPTILPPRLPVLQGNPTPHPRPMCLNPFPTVIGGGHPGRRAGPRLASTPRRRSGGNPRQPVPAVNHRAAVGRPPVHVNPRGNGTVAAAAALTLTVSASISRTVAAAAAAARRAARELHCRSDAAVLVGWRKFVANPLVRVERCHGPCREGRRESVHVAKDTGRWGGRDDGGVGAEVDERVAWKGEDGNGGRRRYGKKTGADNGIEKKNGGGHAVSACLGNHTHESVPQLAGLRPCTAAPHRCRLTSDRRPVNGTHTTHRATSPPRRGGKGRAAVSAGSWSPKSRPCARTPAGGCRRQRCGRVPGGAVGRPWRRRRGRRKGAAPKQTWKKETAAKGCVNWDEEVHSHVGCSIDSGDRLTSSSTTVGTRGVWKDGSIPSPWIRAGSKRRLL